MIQQDLDQLFKEIAEPYLNLFICKLVLDI